MQGRCGCDSRHGWSGHNRRHVLVADNGEEPARLMPEHRRDESEPDQGSDHDRSAGRHPAISNSESRPGADPEAVHRPDRHRDGQGRAESTPALAGVQQNVDCLPGRWRRKVRLTLRNQIAPVPANPLNRLERADVEHSQLHEP